MFSWDGLTSRENINSLKAVAAEPQKQKFLPELYIEISGLGLFQSRNAVINAFKKSFSISALERATAQAPDISTLGYDAGQAATTFDLPPPRSNPLGFFPASPPRVKRKIGDDHVGTGKKMKTEADASPTSNLSSLFNTFCTIL